MGNHRDLVLVAEQKRSKSKMKRLHKRTRSDFFSRNQRPDGSVSYPAFKAFLEHSHQDLIEFYYDPSAPKTQSFVTQQPSTICDAESQMVKENETLLKRATEDFHAAIQRLDEAKRRLKEADAINAEITTKIKENTARLAQSEELLKKLINTEKEAMKEQEEIALLNNSLASLQGAVCKKERELLDQDDKLKLLQHHLTARSNHLEEKRNTLDRSENKFYEDERELKDRQKAYARKFDEVRRRGETLLQRERGLKERENALLESERKFDYRKQNNAKRRAELQKESKDLNQANIETIELTKSLNERKQEFVKLEEECKDFEGKQRAQNEALSRLLQDNVKMENKLIIVAKAMIFDKDLEGATVLLNNLYGTSFPVPPGAFKAKLYICRQLEGHDVASDYCFNYINLFEKEENAQPYLSIGLAALAEDLESQREGEFLPHHYFQKCADDQELSRRLKDTFRNYHPDRMGQKNYIKPWAAAYGEEVYKVLGNFRRMRANEFVFE